MKAKNLLGILWVFFFTMGFVSCDEKDDGSRGFMSNAIIIDNSPNGYYCYLDGGGVVVSYDQRLAGLERGYFSFNYREDDWTTTADNVMYIDNAYVSPTVIYDVLQPIQREEAEKKHITDVDSCAVPPLLSLGYGYRGYIDIHTGLSLVNLKDMEEIPAKINVVYDPAIQTPDTLKLQLYYNLAIPEEWESTSFDYNSVSCDISSLATLTQWSDSITVILEAGDEIEHRTKISKKDFFKPDGKIE